MPAEIRFVLHKSEEVPIMVVSKGIWEYNPYITTIPSPYSPCTIYL